MKSSYSFIYKANPSTAYEERKKEDKQNKREEDWCEFKHNIIRVAKTFSPKNEEIYRWCQSEISSYRWCQSGISGDCNTACVLLNKLSDILRGTYKLEDAQKDFLEYDKAN